MVLEQQLAEAEARLAATSARGDGDELLRARQELRAARRAADAFRDEARAAKAMQVRWTPCFLVPPPPSHP